MKSSSDNQSSIELSSLSVPSVLGVPGTMIEDGQGSGGSSGRSRHSSRSPPLLRRNTALAPRPMSLTGRIPSPAAQRPDAVGSDPQAPEPYSFSATQNVLNVGASPQEVLQAQLLGGEILHNVAMHQVEQQAQGFVVDAMSKLDLLRGQVAEAAFFQLHTALETSQAELTVCQAELTRVQAELQHLQFQLNQQKILCQVKEREIQRLRSAALSATDANPAVSQTTATAYPNQQISSPAPTESIPSWVHLDAPISTSPVIQEAQAEAQAPHVPDASSSDPRIDQLVDAVQMITNRLESLNGTVSPTRRVDGDPSEETMTERKIVDGRALLQMRLEPIPSDAAGFRSWKNHVIVQLGKPDIFGEGTLHEWISAAFNAGSDPDLLDELEQSGQVPRLGSWLASELSSPKTLKQCPDLEQDVQAYIELCTRACVAPKGRRILAIVSRYFDLDSMRGSVITPSTLFQIELHGNSIKDRRDFTQRTRLVLGAVPVAQRPDTRLMGEWLFHRVKHLRKLERYKEDIRQSSSSSTRRDFEILWGEIQDVLVQDREDANVRSMLGYLAPSAKNPTGAAAKADAIPPPPPTTPSPAVSKGLAAPPAPPKAETPGVPAPKFPPKAKAKAKSKTKSISDEEKAKIPCIFHRMPNGCMHGSNCKYSHEDPKSGGIPKGKPKGKEPPPKGKGGPLAKAMVAVIAAASLCKPAAGSGPEYTVEWAADTAAGRHLGSHQALLEQEIPSSAFQSCLRVTDSPVTFSTGSGPQPGVQTLSVNCNNMPEANHYFLESCPVVRSTGLDVESGKAFVWIPGSLPFFVSDASKLRITCPEELKHYAVRVEEHVPIFESKVRFSRGLAATVSGGPLSHSSAGLLSLVLLPVPRLVRLHLCRPKSLVLLLQPLKIG